MKTNYETKPEENELVSALAKLEDDKLKNVIEELLTNAGADSIVLDESWSNLF